jgi:hypothetical protein
MSTEKNGFGKILEFIPKHSSSAANEIIGEPAPIVDIDEVRRKKEITQASMEELKKRAKDLLGQMIVSTEVRLISRQINELMKKTSVHELKQAVQEMLLNPDVVHKDPLAAKAVLHAFILSEP